MPLTPRQERFVQEYMLDLNASQAAIRAGYTEESPTVAAAQLLANNSVAEAIAEAKAELARRNAEMVQGVVNEWAALAFSDIGHLIDFTDGGFRIRNGDEIPPSARRAISSIKVRRESGGEDKPPTDVVEFKLWDKLDALAKLAQHFGLINRKGEPGTTTVNIGVNMQQASIEDMLKVYDAKRAELEQQRKALEPPT